MICLRAHHGMCLQYFAGHGYNEEFIASMQDFIQKCKENDPEICLVCEPDLLCAKCPNKKSGICEAEERVRSYDLKCLKQCGLSENTVIKYSEFLKKVDESILSKGLRKSICSDCQWNDLC